MLTMLIAYDQDGNVVATLSHCVAKDEDGRVVGLIDFEAHEAAGGRLRDIWNQSNAVGSATWPEWLGAAAHDFRVELDPDPGLARAKIARLVHKQSGLKRERRAIEDEIASRIAAARTLEEPADLRDLLGGPGRPLLLDEGGRTRPRSVKKPPLQLPVVFRASENRRDRPSME